jgi:hypothetical protein
VVSTSALSEVDQLIVDLHKMARRLGSGVASLASSVRGDDTTALRRIARDLQRILIDIQRLDTDVDDLHLAIGIGSLGCGPPPRSRLPKSTPAPARSNSRGPTVHPEANSSL